MGTLSFLLPAGLSRSALGELGRGYVTGGPDLMPWPTRVEVNDGVLVVHRDVDESGALVVPWEVDGVGRVMTGSGTLMERGDSYHLLTELARGKVNQLRNQAADWQSGGLELGASLDDRIRACSREFGHAVVGSPNREVEKHLNRTLAQAYEAAGNLVRCYVDQVFQVRHGREPRLRTVLGSRLNGTLSEGVAGPLARATNGAQVAFRWGAIEQTEGDYRWDDIDPILEWADQHDLELTGGPLLDLSPGHLPDWLWLWERDLPTIAKFACAFASQTVKRYRQQIRRWQLTAAGNTSSVLGLREEELLWLTARLAQVVRQIDAGCELVVGVSQPWGEYLAREERTHSPFVFADTLVRSDLNLSSLDLEVVLGVSPRGSYCRDLLETSRLLDLYALLGVPLRVTLGYPASSEPDPAADTEQTPTAGRWQTGFSPATQAIWAREFASLALCKPYVQAVHWVNAADSARHQFPHCGLFDAEEQSRPVLDELRTLRERHLR